MAKIPVPDIPGPTAQLCWKQEALTFIRCDRRRGHHGPHSWEFANLIIELEQQLRRKGDDDSAA